LKDIESLKWITEIRSFNCEVLFCSDLLDNEQHIVDASSFYDQLHALNISRISEFINACHEITPSGCIWWYNIDWDEERQTHERYWQIKEIFDEPGESEYFGRAKLMISMKR
jgi:hypothetical protein